MIHLFLSPLSLASKIHKFTTAERNFEYVFLVVLNAKIYLTPFFQMQELVSSVYCCYDNILTAENSIKPKENLYGKTSMRAYYIQCSHIKFKYWNGSRLIFEITQQYNFMPCKWARATTSPSCHRRAFDRRTFGLRSWFWRNHVLFSKHIFNLWPILYH